MFVGSYGSSNSSMTLGSWNKLSNIFSLKNEGTKRNDLKILSKSYQSTILLYKKKEKEISEINIPRGFMSLLLCWNMILKVKCIRLVCIFLSYA